MIARFSLSDDVAPLLERPLIHTFHHVSCLVRLQSLQELVFIQGVCDKLLLTGCKQKPTKFKIAGTVWVCYSPSIHSSQEDSSRFLHTALPALWHGSLVSTPNVDKVRTLPDF